MRPAAKKGNKEELGRLELRGGRAKREGTWDFWLGEWGIAKSSLRPAGPPRTPLKSCPKPEHSTHLDLGARFM